GGRHQDDRRDPLHQHDHGTFAVPAWFRERGAGSALAGVELEAAVVEEQVVGGTATSVDEVRVTGDGAPLRVAAVVIRGEAGDDGPSKPSFCPLQPDTGTSKDRLAGKQATSSASVGSWSPGAPSRPVQVPSAALTAEQKSKCPISSENDTLPVCAAHNVSAPA